MIVEATSLVLAGLNTHLHAQMGDPVGSPDVALLGNPAEADDETVGPGLSNRIILSVLNLEEEAALKNGQTTFTEAGGVTIRHRPVHLNLLLLFAANFPNYQTALERLSQTVTYFQSQKRFDPSRFPGVLPNLAPGTDLSATMELVTLNLEEMSFVWGAFGGQHMPFATYRARLVVLAQDRPSDTAGEIRDIPIQLHDTGQTLSGGG